MAVSYPIARDVAGNWVSIEDVEKHTGYRCPECEAPFVARLGRIKTHHFAHRSGYTGVCTGESGYHHLAKHLLAHHFDEQEFILLLTKCPTCAKVIETKQLIAKTEVEKGDGEHRPDVRLHLKDGTVIECEVVFKNPLGGKFDGYLHRQASLIVWRMAGPVDRVPPSVHYYWDDADEYASLWNSAHFTNRLLVLASPPSPKHRCTPHCTAYLFQADCWKCGDSESCSDLLLAPHVGQR